MWDEIVAWLLRLGDDYGVDPIVYAVIYVGAAPPMFVSLAWLVRRLRKGESVGLPFISTAFFFSAPTLYALVAGRNLPWWAYVGLLGLAAIGAIVTARRIRERIRRPD